MFVIGETKTATEHAKQQLLHWLNHRKLSMHFQPIVHTAQKTIQGYEALARFPRSDYISSPVELFQLADEMDQLFYLEKHTRELAIELIERYLNPHQKLWVNLSPNVIHDKAFTPGFTHSVIENTNLTARQIVFEITEQSAIKDLDSFKQLLNHYREQGFTVAIDDVGAGYSSLQAISEIKPDYLKVDRSLIMNIQHSSEKQFMLEALQHISSKMGSSLIAEGVETETEFAKLTAMGVEMMQGYYFAKPTYPPLEVPYHLLEPTDVNYKDDGVKLIVSSNLTFQDFYLWLSQYTGPIDRQLATIKTEKIQVSMPLQEVIRFAAYSNGSSPSKPVWRELLQWWRS
ncbi:EAL domain-containing protein [Halobacillus salinus]|uniref:EAL domain-containing protein n=1 Tax=Halobacillus salinus TaxID=192814 RepID=A0A4Z0H448_9BACI|nr:EAL domain-containing protein [Halobacillus salinus]TGB05202.1 EAL domain-containing protein [Halobacillus salinus]